MITFGLPVKFGEAYTFPFQAPYALDAKKGKIF
jgi:hypothetical protein